MLAQENSLNIMTRIETQLAGNSSQGGRNIVIFADSEVGFYPMLVLHGSDFSKESCSKANQCD